MSTTQFPNEELMPFSSEPTPPPTERLLEPKERVQIDLNMPLADDWKVSLEVGIEGIHVASVDASSKRFLIIDTRATGKNRDFYIIDDTFSPSDKQGFKGVLEGKPVTIGRNHFTNRFSYPSTISRDHFQVVYEDGELFIRNLEPTNRTVVTAHLKEREGKLVEKLLPFIGHATRTESADERIRQNPNFGEKDDTAPYGYYMNHPILGRQSTSVDGGVYLGGSAREAIVVDGKSDAIKGVYDSLNADLQSSLQRNETLLTRVILLKVMHKVQEVMPYNEVVAEKIGRQHSGDKLVGLSTFLKERAGVCRHQGLLAAYLVERLIRDGYMVGGVGVERNTVPGMGGTHAWAVYKAPQGGVEQVIVVDPAQSFVGTKAQAQQEGRWDYRLVKNEYGTQ